MVIATSSAAPPLVDLAVGIHHRDYQDVGRDFLYSRKRAMLTDAPGLGKTPQGALAAVPPCLIVAPNYLVGQWKSWLEEHFPTLQVRAARGDRWSKMKTLDEFSVEAFVAAGGGGMAHFLVINKEMLRTHLPRLRQISQRFNTLIIDEAHHMRNRNTEAAKGALDLARNIERVYLLTATPIWREVDDLFMQLRLLQPQVFPSYNAFVRTWCMVDDTGWGLKVTGVKKEMRAELTELLDIMRLGRSYKDVNRQLPRVIDAPVKLEFSAEMRARYDLAVEEFRVRFAGEGGEDLLLMSNSAVMHTLRQFTGWPGKVEAVIELIEDAHAYTKGASVIFTWYRDIAESIAQSLNDKGHPAVFISGAITPDARREASKGDKIVVATIASLSEGVDLSWARHVIFAEQNWVPGSAIQSLARVVRERQTATDTPEDILAANEEPVLVHYVVVRDTIDETIYNATRRRSATIRDLLRETLKLGEFS